MEAQTTIQLRPTTQPKNKFRIIFPENRTDWIFLFASFVIGLTLAWRFAIAEFALSGVIFFLLLLHRPLSQWASTGFRTFPVNVRTTMILATVHVFFLTALLVYKYHLGALWPLLAAGLVLAIIGIWPASRSEAQTAIGKVLYMGLLTLSAPAAFSVARGTLTIEAWLLWVTCWVACCVVSFRLFSSSKKPRSRR